MFLLKLGSSLWLEETNHGKTQETQPHSQSAHDKRVVSVKKVSLTWLFETSGNLTRLWCTSLLGLIEISDPRSTWIDHLSFEVASNIFCYRCCYRYLASCKSQRSPFLLSTATQVTSSMVMEDSAMLVAKITWTQCNECQYPNQGSCWNGLEGNTVSANYHVAAAWYQVHPRHSKNVGFFSGFLQFLIPTLRGRSAWPKKTSISPSSPWPFPLVQVERLPSVLPLAPGWDAMGWDPWKNWPLSSYTTWPFLWIDRWEWRNLEDLLLHE